MSITGLKILNIISRDMNNNMAKRSKIKKTFLKYIVFFSLLTSLYYMKIRLFIHIKIHRKNKIILYTSSNLLDKMINRFEKSYVDEIDQWKK